MSPETRKYLPWILGGGGLLIIGSAVLGRRVVLGNSGPLVVKSVGNNQWMASDAADAFNSMVAAAAADGVTLLAGSGFRSVIEQGELYALWKAGLYHVPAVAPPGQSNHGTGNAVDLANASGQSISSGSAEFAWVQANGPTYGFSWHEGSVINEPWHWDYVG